VSPSALIEPRFGANATEKVPPQRMPVGVGVDANRACDSPFFGALKSVNRGPIVDRRNRGIDERPNTLKVNQRFVSPLRRPINLITRTPMPA